MNYNNYHHLAEISPLDVFFVLLPFESGARLVSSDVLIFLLLFVVSFLSFDASCPFDHPFLLLLQVQTSLVHVAWNTDWPILYPDKHDPLQNVFFPWPLLVLIISWAIDTFPCDRLARIDHKAIVEKENPVRGATINRIQSSATTNVP